MTSPETGPDYRTALEDAGFDSASVEKGLRMLESGLYFGFGDVVSTLQVFESNGQQRPHVVDAVVVRVTEEERRTALARGIDERLAGGRVARIVAEADLADRRARCTEIREEQSRIIRGFTNADLKLDRPSAATRRYQELSEELAELEGTARRTAIQGTAAAAGGPATATQVGQTVRKVQEIQEPGRIAGSDDLSLIEQARARWPRGRM